MIPVLYPASATDFSSFGLGVLTDTISCEVTEERNGVFECLLKYPVSGQHYGLITKECIIEAKPCWLIQYPMRSACFFRSDMVSYAHIRNLFPVPKSTISNDYGGII